MSDDDYEYDVDDPRTREHLAYKIAQDNRGRANRRFRYGDDVDARESPQEEEDEDEDSPSEDDNDDNDDRLDEQLRNAREARGWAVDEANRRYAWNGQWTGGVHEGVEEQADTRMEEVTGHGGWNDRIGQLERAIAARDAESGSSDDDDPAVEEDVHEEQETLWEGRSERERGYRYAQDFNGAEEAGDEEEEEEDEDDDDDEGISYNEDVDSDSDSDW